MTKRDYYKVLDIPRTANEHEIKSAYRKLALKYHPDRNPDNAQAEEQFKEAAEAYSILADTEKRHRYDRFGHAGLGGTASAPDFNSTVFSDFGDILGGLGDLFGFGDILGGSRGHSGITRGADLRYDLQIPFKEAATGTETTLQIPRREICDRCNGSRAETGSSPETCPQCYGRGQVRFQQGFLTVAQTCGQCSGRGQVIANPCTSCLGQGLVEQERKLKVKIPAGIATGQRLRLQGEGEHGTGGSPPGDLYVVVHVEEHPFLHRDGDDLWCEIPVTYPTLALGGKISVPTLNGEQQIAITKGTQPGARLRLRGQGMPQLSGNGQGSMYVILKVEVPIHLSKDQQELIKKLDQIMPVKSSKPSPLSNGDEGRPFFERVRDIFG